MKISQRQIPDELHFKFKPEYIINQYKKSGGLQVDFKILCIAQELDVYKAGGYCLIEYDKVLN